MADTLTLQTTPATPAAGKIVATYEVASFQGETNAHVAPTVLGSLSGSEGSWAFTQIGTANPLPISDGGGIITVDGAVTVSGTATVSGTVAATQSGTWTLGANSGVDIGDVTINNASGASAVNIQDGGNIITVDGTVAATQSGTWNVGTVTTVTGVTTVSTVTNVATIGTSVTPGTSAAHLGKAVDAVAGASDTGVALLAVRDDSLSTLTPADGDYTHLRVSSTGALHVTGAAGTTQYVEDTAAGGGESVVLLGVVRQDTLAADTTTDGDYQRLKSDNTGALYVTGSAGTAVMTDDAVFTEATSKVAVIGAFATTSAVDSGDGGALGMTATRALYTNIRDDAGDSCMDGTNNAVRVNIVAGAGSGGTAVADRTGTFTPGTTSFTPIGGYMDDAASDALSEGNPGAARVTSARALHVCLASSATGTAIVNGSGTATGALRVELPTNGTGVIATVSTVTNVATIGTSVTPGTSAAHLGKAVDAAVGASDTGVAALFQRVDSPATITPAVNDYTRAIVDSMGKQWVTGTYAEDSAHTSGDLGHQMLGVRAASPTERSAGPTDGDYVPIGVNEVGAQWVTPTPSANGGSTTMAATSQDSSTALTSTAQAIKASAGTLTGYYIYNPNATAAFVNFYNVASGSVTVGTTAPLFHLAIPATSAANLSYTFGPAFSTAISWSATATAGSNTAPTTALEAVAWYK
jgi:hypothetical protein